MRLIGIGAGGLARVVIELIRARGDHQIVGLLDARRECHGTTLLDVPVLGDDGELSALKRGGVEGAFIGVGSVGNLDARIRLFQMLSGAGWDLPPLVHPQACVSPSAGLGTGSVVLAGAVIGTAVTLGANVVVWSGAVIEHDTVVEDHAHVGPGVAIAGGTRVGAASFVGIGASIIQGITIGARAVVGAGAVVLKDVAPDARVAGIPAAPFRAMSS